MLNKESRQFCLFGEWLAANDQQGLKRSVARRVGLVKS